MKFLVKRLLFWKCCLRLLFSWFSFFLMFSVLLIIMFVVSVISVRMMFGICLLLILLRLFVMLSVINSVIRLRVCSSVCWVCFGSCLFMVSLMRVLRRMVVILMNVLDSCENRFMCEWIVVWFGGEWCGWDI